MGAEQGDAEDEAAEDVAGSAEVEQGLETADVTVFNSAISGCDGVVDEPGLGVDQVGQDSFNRPLAVPEGIALIGLGVSLWRNPSDSHQTSPEPAVSRAGQLAVR